MWHYMMGTEAAFDGAPEQCTTIVRTVADGALHRGEDDLLRDDPPRQLVAYRQWISDEGWIDWPGGACPLTTGTINLRLRSGRFIFCRSPILVGGNWQHHGGRKDIVAYRLRPEPVRAADDVPIPF